MIESRTQHEASAVCVKLQQAELGLEGMDNDPLLKDVNWEVRSGEFWVVGGMHRSGKSTLLATLAMLQKPLSGKIELFGVDPWGADGANLMKQRLRVGLLFESGARLLHQLSVVENVALPLCYHRDCRLDEAQERVDELLSFAGIEGLHRDLPGEMTRTYRQRVSLARALALSPELLLLDNPLAGVDLSEQNWWQGTVTKLSEGHPITGGKPMTIVIVTNQLTPWVEKGRNFALLQGKQWRQIGGMTELESSDEAVLRELQSVRRRTE
jgi:phospholipid/cholesterol/gamma-HCH transport system ATP-binding protein